MMQLLKPKLPDAKYYVEIGSVARIREGIQYAFDMGEPVRITSQAGYGKTTALFYLARELGGSYCQIGQAQKSTPDMYRALLAACGIFHDRNYARDLFSLIIDRLGPYSPELLPEKQRRRLIVIDEIQTLEATALRELLNIQETCDLALVMSGNGERIARSKIDQAAWKQIDSRVGMEISLPGLSRKDCELMGASYGVEGLDAYAALASYGTRTTARMLGRLLESARVLTAGTGAIRLSHLEIAMAGNPKLGDARLLRPEAA
jgi:DNA transposition AAA+ family ATPase